MSWRRRKDGEDGAKPSCLLDLIASTWVDFFHAAFVSRLRPNTDQSIVVGQRRNESGHLQEEPGAGERAAAHERGAPRPRHVLRHAAAARGRPAGQSVAPFRCSHGQLVDWQTSQEKVAQLARQALAYKRGKNLAGARKKMLERARAQSQLDKIQNSILMIDMHRATIEGTAIDISVLEALKASGDTLRQMGATGQVFSCLMLVCCSLVLLLIENEQGQVCSFDSVI